MQVLVNTAELSDVARVEVEAIAAARVKRTRASVRSIRNERKREFSPPGTGNPAKFQRTDDSTLADGKRSTLKHDARIVDADGPNA